MWRLGDVSDVGSTVGRASVESDTFTPIGPHLAPWTVFVWSGREVCFFFFLSLDSDAFTPIGPHLAPWTVFVWSGWELCVFFLYGGEWTQQEVDFEG